MASLILLLIGLATLSGKVLAYEGQDKWVTIKFNEIAGIKYYEVQWLTKSLLQSEMAQSEAIEVFSKSPINRKVEEKFRYFRIRSVSQADIRSDWSISHPIRQTTDVFRKVKYANVFERLFLSTDKLSLESLGYQRPVYFAINNQQKKRYQEPLSFSDDGQYQLDIYHTRTQDDQSPDAIDLTTPSRSYVFWVDRSAPSMSAFFYSPMCHTDGEMRIGGNGKIALQGQDDLSGLDKVFFRIYAVGLAETEYQLYRGPFVVKDVSGISDGQFILEFYGYDTIGNKSAVYSREFSLDSKPPQILLQVGDKEMTSMETIYAKKEDVLRWKILDQSRPVVVSIYVDNAKINESEVYNSVSYPLTQHGPGKIELKILATDLLENTANWQANILVE